MQRVAIDWRAPRLVSGATRKPSNPFEICGFHWTRALPSSMRELLQDGGIGRSPSAVSFLGGVRFVTDCEIVRIQRGNAVQRRRENSNEQTSSHRCVESNRPS